MNILVYTQPADLHAVVIEQALQSTEHHVCLFFSADQPTLLTHSAWITQSLSSLKTVDKVSSYKLDPSDVVWYRRPHRPVVEKSRIHPEDYEFSFQENRLFFEAINVLLSQQGWWVNPLQAASKANAKLYQLNLAKAVGFTIPETLCSNDPEDIRGFVSRHEKHGVIYKPLCSSFWFESAGLRAIYTSLIRTSQLPDAETLRLTPGIFQSLIKKKYELRITCFGSYAIAVKINSQKNLETQLDWRVKQTHDLEVTPYLLPNHIKSKLVALMQSLGIVFGCVDMIVTPENEYVFLEVNEQGQFLWIEEYLPHLPILDCFIQFMLNRSFYFHWDPKKYHYQLSDYQNSAQQTIDARLIRHLDVRKKRKLECTKNMC